VALSPFGSADAFYARKPPCSRGSRSYNTRTAICNRKEKKAEKAVQTTVGIGVGVFPAGWSMEARANRAAARGIGLLFEVLLLRHTMEQERHNSSVLLVMNAVLARAALEKASAQRDVTPASFLHASTASSEVRMKYGPVEGCDPRCLGPRRS